MRYGGRPGIKFLAIGSIAGAQTLGYAVSTHRTPFIVIAFQPDVIQILKPIILRDLLRRQVAVVVKNRLVFRVIVVQAAGKLGIKQKIFGHKRCHFRVLFAPWGAHQMIDYNADKVITPISTGRSIFRELDQ